MSNDSSRSGWYGLRFLALTVLVADQASKFAVQKFTQAGSLRVVIPGLINLVHTSNPGVAFGLLADSTSPWLATVLIVFSTAVIGLLPLAPFPGDAVGRR